MMSRTSRSQRYQYRMNEVACGNASDLDRFSCDFDIMPNPDEGLIADLRFELVERIAELMKECLTKRQYQIAMLYYFSDATQADIAKHIGINQTSVHKTINGNIVYSENKKKVTPIRYGGTIKKIRQALSQDVKANKILKRLIEADDFYAPKEFIVWNWIRE